MPNKYPELLKYEGEFLIKIEENVYFRDEYFAIFEFLHCAKQWIAEKTDMIFNSAETEDNPLLSFICTNGMWKIYSPWQIYECNKLFKREEIVSAINNLIKQLGY